jgi:micrococcal nuclease
MRLADGRTESVRFIGVDTPEAGRPYFRESTQYTSDRIVGRQIFLELDVEQRDRFGRLLAYVWLAEPAAVDEANIREHMLNARMLIDGFAALYTVPPNVRYVDYLTRYQQEARAANRGLWTPPPPAQQSSPNCHPSYADVCLPPDAYDVDCPGGSGDGPVYAPRRNFRVVGPDVYGLDRDGDGIACES